MKNRDIAILVLVTAIWGFNFSLIKLGLQQIDPYLLAATRFFLCAIPAILFIKRSAVAWPYLMAYGVIFGAVQWGLIYAGIGLGVSVGIASMLTQTSVFMTMGLGIVIYREKLDLSLVLGTLLSFSGVYLIFFYADAAGSVLGMALMLLGAFAWSISNLIVKKAGTKEMFAFLIWSSLFAPVPLLMMSWLVSGPQAMTQSLAAIDGIAIFSIAFQVIPTTLFGYSVWNHMMQKYPVSQVAPLSLLVPVFGMLASIVIFREVLPTYKWVAIGLIFGGLIVQRLGGRFVVLCKRMNMNLSKEELLNLISFK